jgi:hypothetical protein
MVVLAVPSYAQQDRALVREDPEVSPSVMPIWSDEVVYSTGDYLDNPCTAEQDWVWVEYSAYVESAQQEAGIDRFNFFESTTMSGGMSASGTSEADVGYGAAFEVRKYHKVNTPDEFHVVTVINFDPGSQYTWVTMETACGNGMPDSAQ